MAEYIYRCAKLQQTFLVGPTQEVLTSAPPQVRCLHCKQLHYVWRIVGLPWDGWEDWERGKPPFSLTYWPTSPALNGIHVHKVGDQDMTLL